MFCLHFCAVKFVNQVYQVFVTSFVTCQMEVSLVVQSGTGPRANPIGTVSGSGTKCITIGINLSNNIILYFHEILFCKYMIFENNLKSELCSGFRLYYSLNFMKIRSLVCHIV